jgi:NAD-dependent deacetylase
MALTEGFLLSIDRATEIVARSRYLVALVGAGMSVESGIPPFRGTGGLWTKYGEPDMRGYERFRQDPKAWWIARLTEPRRPEMSGWETARPNPGHYALVDLEKIGVLKYIITQNVDNLHKEAGSVNVAEIHGNRTLMRCADCHKRFPQGAFSLALEDLPPLCPVCGGVVKGDGVAFGEPIPPDVLAICQREALRADCMILLGTSAVVYPAAAFPILAKQRGAQLIEVNTEGSALTHLCDVVIPGPTGEVLPVLLQRLRELLEV